MRDTLLLFAVFAAAYAGFALLAISQAKHMKRVTAAAPDASCGTVTLRIPGAVLLAASLVLAVLRDAAGFGILLWAATISIAAVAVAFTLTWRPRWLRPVLALFAVRHSRHGR